MRLLDRIAPLAESAKELEIKLSDPELASDVKQFIAVQREYARLNEILAAGNQYRATLANLQSAKSMLLDETDEEMRSLAREEIQTLESQIPHMEEQLRMLLVPKDPEDHRNAILEVRGGTGGDEAAIFAGDLYRMYARFCEERGFSMELVESTPGTSGGFKEIIVNVIGPDAYGTLKFESGVHRVQRVPATETQGRIHTSAASVVVLPEADELDVQINPNDIRKDTFCSSGAGGQSVNTTYSAVRLTHIPSGIVVSCQDERSQLRNFDKAMQVLRSRLYEMMNRERMANIAGKRKSMVSTGDRSAKIRTYNFPQSRITDHRINFSMYDLPSVMNGNLWPMIAALQTAENAHEFQDENHG